MITIKYNTNVKGSVSSIEIFEDKNLVKTIHLTTEKVADPGMGSDDIIVKAQEK